MSLILLSPTDLTRAQVQALFARADEIAQGAAPKLTHISVALALFNQNFPLPVAASKALTEAGADVSTIISPNKIGGANVQVVLFSSSETRAANLMAGKTDASFLNAGDGTNENPVRALLDAYAIRTLKGGLENNRIAILGNAKFSAEAHSLARLLGLFGVRLTFITTSVLSMPYDLTDEVRSSAYEVEETNDLPTTLRKTDVLYLANIDATRVEKKIYDKQKTFYTLTQESFTEAKEGMVVLGEWEGGEAILSATRPAVERAARAMLLALVEAAAV